jgi:hypothetical protein
MNLITKLLVGITACLFLTFVALTFIGGAVVELATPWGVRSGYDWRVESPPPMAEKLPLAISNFGIGLAALILMIYVVRWLAKLSGQAKSISNNF